MGQKNCSYCKANGFPFCNPQEPESEAQTQIEASGNHSYPRTSPEAHPDSQTNGGSNHWGENQEPDDFGHCTPLVAPAPTADTSLPQAATPSPSPASQPTHNVTFDLVLSDLEQAEDQAWGSAFKQFDDSKRGSVQMDHVLMREFLIENSALTMDTLDTALLRLLDEDGGVDVGKFLMVLRTNAVDEGQTIEQFMNLARENDSIPSEDCRSGLHMFGTQWLQTNFSQEQWDRIFNVIMMDAGAVVPMEQWHNYSLNLGRITRLVNYCKI